MELYLCPPYMPSWCEQGRIRRQERGKTELERLLLSLVPLCFVNYTVVINIKATKFYWYSDPQNARTIQADYVQYNIDALSYNHCCSGKLVNITYSECVFIVLGM
jgi:hypothetical protein